MAEEKENLRQEENREAEGAEERKLSAAEEMQRQIEELREQIETSNAIIATGMGRLKLEKPIVMGDRTFEELIYDFTDMTGIEYTEAMDSDRSADQVYRITYRQSLALFARCAAKHTPGLDMRDILENIGITDALEGGQLATIFFNASTRSGRIRSSKK